MNPTDYSQPEFFRFGWDSLFLVKEVLARTSFGHQNGKLLELGTGSGVIACELSQQLTLASCVLVEAQREWQTYLEMNLQQFCTCPDTSIHWQRVSEFNLAGQSKFELVVCNPPYFDPARGKPSPDQFRNIAHRLVLDPWSEWLKCMERSLAIGGEAWFLQKDPGPSEGQISLSDGFVVKHEVRSGPMRLLCLRRLHIE